MSVLAKSIIVALFVIGIIGFSTVMAWSFDRRRNRVIANRLGARPILDPEEWFSQFPTIPANRRKAIGELLQRLVGPWGVSFTCLRRMDTFSGTLHLPRWKYKWVRVEDWLELEDEWFVEHNARPSGVPPDRLDGYVEFVAQSLRTNDSEQSPRE